ncbi:MAG TPA: DNA recombination protein RmuC [Allosphingosinicella sp.]|nr:DNA recombination protein RmuC [Allosphingosinicella sp.]
MDPLLLIVVAGAILLSLVLGWWLGARGVAPLRADLEKSRAEVETLRSDAESWRDRFNKMGVDLAATAEQASRLPQLEAQLDAERRAAAEQRAEAAGLRPLADRALALERELCELRTEKEALSSAKAAHERGEAERAQAHAEQVDQLTSLRTELEQRFAALASQAVDGAHQKLMEQAKERFGQSERQTEEKLKALLQPVETSLKQHRELIDRVEAARAEAYGNLAGVIGEVRAGQEAVRSEAAKLVNSLRSAPKARGRWGEQQLRNVLETCGLSEHCDFAAEVSIVSEEGRLRPDVIVRIPGGKTLVIDAKVSLNAYQDAFAATDDRERSIGLTAHAAAMKAHVNGLGNKAYWAQFADAPDYVIMFVPGEHFLAAALEQDPQLWDFAFEKRVLLATPTNLIAIARTVAAVWRQEKLADQAKKIGELGTLLHERLAVVSEHLKRVGSGLSTAVNNYNGFVGSFERNVLSTAREFKTLGVETGKRTEIEALTPVESLPRYAEAVEPIMIEELPGEPA